MVKTKYRTLYVLALIVLLLSFAYTGKGQVSSETDSDEILRKIPSDCLFCVRINNFEDTLSMLDQYLAGGSPMPMGTSMLIRMQLANILGSPQLTGLNM